MTIMARDRRQSVSAPLNRPREYVIMITNGPMPNVVLEARRYQPDAPQRQILLRGSLAIVNRGELGPGLTRVELGGIIGATPVRELHPDGSLSDLHFKEVQLTVTSVCCVYDERLKSQYSDLPVFRLLKGRSVSFNLIGGKGGLLRLPSLEH